jgi:hypothetical protein
MKVFISWSGERNAFVAQALRDWLPNVIQALEPWLSKADIDQGARWSTEIAVQLQDSKIGIICLTPENLREPWILFEAGALSKTLDQTFVCPYLIDLDTVDLEWPLAMFQATKADKESTKLLMKTINHALDKRALAESRLDGIFEVWWPELEQKLRGLPPRPGAKPVRDQRVILEEIVDLARNNTMTSQQTVALLHVLKTQVQNIFQLRAPRLFNPFPAEANWFQSLTANRSTKVDDTGRLYYVTSLLEKGSRQNRTFEWRGFKPPAGRNWKFSVDRLESLMEKGRISLNGRFPKLRIYAADAPTSPDTR